MKKNGILKKVRRSLFGRILCRIVGEEKGAVMMEYVVVCLLIAAACVIGVAFFGHNITAAFGVLGEYMFGNTKTGADTLNSARGQNANNYKSADKHNAGMHDGTATGDQTYSAPSGGSGSGGGTP